MKEISVWVRVKEAIQLVAVSAVALFVFFVLSGAITLALVTK